MIVLLVVDDRVPAGRVLILTAGDPDPEVVRDGTTAEDVELALSILDEREIPRGRGTILVPELDALRAGLGAAMAVES